MKLSNVESQILIEFGLKLVFARLKNHGANDRLVKKEMQVDIFVIDEFAALRIGMMKDLQKIIIAELLLQSCKHSHYHGVTNVRKQFA